MTRAYYNERDPYAAQWLRNLIAAKLICAGDVDDRDIRDVCPSDLDGYTQCHFFAGIGVWSYALRLAGWPDDRPVWTGSCPCQPFSAAGRGGGFADERHLWPHWHHLIRERRPPVIFGEQVASKDGLGWLDLVQSDLEGTDYACGAVDICAAGVGAPHIRQRLWLVAYANGEPRGLSEYAGRTPSPEAVRGGEASLVADAEGIGCDARWDGQPKLPRIGRGQLESCRPGSTRLLGDAGCSGLSARQRSAEDRKGREERRPTEQPSRSPCAFGHNGGPRLSFWSDAEWIDCRDGKARPVEPGTFPLAHGAPARVGRLRAYGNATSPHPAAEVIQAFLQAEQIRQGA